MEGDERMNDGLCFFVKTEVGVDDMSQDRAARVLNVGECR